MVAMGQSNALAVMAFAPRGSLLHAPDMYMKKLVVNRFAKGAINLALPLADNLRNVAVALGKPLERLRMVTLDKPRLQPTIAEATRLGVKVFALPEATVPQMFGQVAQAAASEGLTMDFASLAVANSRRAHRLRDPEPGRAVDGDERGDGPARGGKPSEEREAVGRDPDTPLRIGEEAVLVAFVRAETIVRREDPELSRRGDARGPPVRTGPDVAVRLLADPIDVGVG